MSCDSSVESNNFVLSNGFLKKIETSTWQYGTHTLNDGQGKPIYALKRSNLNLDDFNNKEVKIRGEQIKNHIGGGQYMLMLKALKQFNRCI
jgi:hypothetical protein